MTHHHSKYCLTADTLSVHCRCTPIQAGLVQKEGPTQLLLQQKSRMPSAGLVYLVIQLKCYSWHYQGLFYKSICGAETGHFGLLSENFDPFWGAKYRSIILADLYWSQRGRKSVENGRKSADRRTRTMPALCTYHMSTHLQPRTRSGSSLKDRTQCTLSTSGVWRKNNALTTRDFKPWALYMKRGPSSSGRPQSSI